MSAATTALCALNASTGAKLWSSPAGGSSPAVANGVVYAGCGAHVYALNASTGAKLWSYPIGGYSPAVANGVVYIGTGDGREYALNASTGAKLWGLYNGGFGFLARRGRWGGLSHCRRP